MKPGYKRTVNAIVFLTVVLLLTLPARSAQPAGTKGVPPDWLFLQGSYWYVPTANLPALLSTTTGGGTFAPISDQTVFFIQQYAGGYSGA
jgi:hypothetical protein